ncbi:MAG: alternative ribosome rescue aminoacyl-tRNA hydrolase ArfB [Gemmatimonadales bacterium]|nr:alternative ribosome rescue aminoacyl-tRNA hydrolase ArfB [Gemmatimonadales bacterium]
MPPRPPLDIPAHEIHFQASRAGGPGGQHVNTSSTRVELRWHVPTTAALRPDERIRVLERLANRIDGEGWLRVVAADSRSQTQNRDRALERLIAMVEQARIVPKVRRATKVPRAQKQERLDTKKRRGGIKQQRRRPRADD